MSQQLQCISVNLKRTKEEIVALDKYSQVEEDEEGKEEKEKLETGVLLSL